MLTFSNITSDTFEVESRAGRKRPRHRQAICCAYCRLRKIRCDKASPCKQCKDRGAPEDCLYDGSSITTSTTTTTTATTATRSTPASNAESSEPSPPAPVPARPRPASGRTSTVINEDHHKVARSDESSHINDHDPRNAAPPAPVSTLPAPNIDRSLQAPSRTRSTFKGKKSKTGLMEGTHWMAACNDLTIVKAFLDKEEPFQVSCTAFAELKTHIKEANTIPGSLLMNVDAANLYKLLPPRGICLGWIGKYRETYGRLYNIIDDAALETLMQGVYGSDTDTNKDDVNLATGKSNAVFVSEICLVVAIAMQSRDSERLKGRRLARYVEYCCYSSPQFQKPCIGVLRTLLLLLMMKNICSADTNKPDGALGILGLTNQIVFGMGLHRDPSLFDNVSLRDANIRTELWACFLRLNLDFCIRTGRQISFRLEDCDCPLPRGPVSTDEVDGRSESDSSFSIVAAKLTKTILPVHQAICSPSTQITTALQTEMQQAFDEINLEIPLHLKGKPSSEVEQLQQAYIMIGMQKFNLLLSSYLASETSHKSLFRGLLFDVWHNSISTIHQFTNLLQRSSDTRNMAFQFLWSDVCRAAFNASLVLGKLRNMESQLAVFTKPQQTLSPFQQALTQEFSLLSRLWLSKSHCGSVAAKTYSLLAIIEAVTIHLFSDPLPKSSQTLYNVGAAAAEQSVLSMREAIQLQNPVGWPPLTESLALSLPEAIIHQSLSMPPIMARLSAWSGATMFDSAGNYEMFDVQDFSQTTAGLNSSELQSLSSTTTTPPNFPLSSSASSVSLHNENEAWNFGMTWNENKNDFASERTTFDFNPSLDFDLNSTLLLPISDNPTDNFYGAMPLMSTNWQQN